MNNSRNGDGKKPKAKFITPKSASTTGSDVLKDLHFFKAKHSNSSTISRNISSPTTSEPTETASRVEKTGLTVPPRSRATRNVSKTESSNNKQPFTISKNGSCFVMSRAKPAKPPSNTKPAFNKAKREIKTPTANSQGPTLSTNGTLPTSSASQVPTSRSPPGASRPPSGASQSPPSQTTSETSSIMPKDIPPPQSTSDQCPTLSRPNDDTSSPEIFAVKKVLTPVNDTPTETSHDESKDDEVDSSNYKCDKCGKSFSYLARFISHQERGNCDVKVFKCQQCEVKFGQEKNLIRHVKNLHQKTKYECCVCSRLFTNKETGTKHMKNNHDLNECTYCHKFYKNKNVLRSHRNKCKVKKSMDIQKDNERTEQQTELEAANNTATEDENENVGMRNNKKAKSDEKSQNYQRACSLCKKVYRSRGGYSRHMKIHRRTDKSNHVVKDDVPIEESVYILQNDLECVDENNGFYIVTDAGDTEHELT